ncbi:5-bromo-4-chloroindolyl phosphate hydrolysis family protein [Limibaculum sp. M0105]|uniref:5-bromo-4-chloroindolyl phosphate hydrolysis family protein n=1 Tax=Thermohalobaculum xanthum TaxID=2753746 RepID=A0A8J7MA92_9RHOB|nr:5-bromo-4-chloroindolyl phosphate hydrolysis family protein [Thermohalobaculum xanthum]MBK0400650.1 5-bromo-4-chloroindolyl phosphate hydrolysis family protein [Thermohalobaculum xanthum]
MSARRYGGAHSPGTREAGPGAPPVGQDAPRPWGGDRFRGRRAASIDVRGMLLFVLPLPLLFAAFSDIALGNVVAAVADLAALALLLGGAWMLREGQKAEAAFEARSVARRPAVPRKIIAAAAAGLGVALASYAGWGQGLPSALGMGALATASHLMAFGIDPLKNKGIDIADSEAGRVAEALDKAEARLAEITRLGHTIRDREIETRLDTLMSAVRGLLRQVEGDPRDLPRARRYLSVYLTGAHEATRKYAETHETLADPALRRDYLALLGDLETSFERGRKMLLENERTDLEVEIEVLRERLEQEQR